MTAESIRELLDAAPFVPFSVQLANGRKIRVAHPDFTLLSPGRRTLIVYSEGEHFDMVDVMLITNVIVEGPSARRKRSAQR